MKTGKCTIMLTMEQRRKLLVAGTLLQLEWLRRANHLAGKNPAKASELRADAADLNAAVDVLEHTPETERFFGTDGPVLVDGTWRVAVRGDVTAAQFNGEVAAQRAYAAMRSNKPVKEAS